MCGFGGIINSEGVIASDQLLNIASKVNFRGPDYTGIRIFDNSFQLKNKGIHAFFHNRLSIIDLDTRANQPFEDDDCLLLFNGEIYNFIELKNILKLQGFGFVTTSDTEVLFYSLKHWGINAISKLNGMFSFVFINKRTNRLIIAKDRLGIKPLYYRSEGSSFIFASEIDSIVRMSKEKPDIDQSTINSFIFFQYVPSPFSILDNVCKLPPGHYIETSIQEIKERREVKPIMYWDSNNQIQGVRGSKPLEDLLVSSIKMQLKSDVPLGLFLSSGVDSSLLVAILNKHFSDNKISTFTVAFGDDTISDESVDAENYIRGFNSSNIIFNKLTINSKTVIKKLLNLYNYIDEPFGDHAVLLNWSIAEEARKHVKVILSGDAADELFYGYPRYVEWKKYIGVNRDLKFEIIKKLKQLIDKEYRESRMNEDRVSVYLKMLNHNYHKLSINSKLNDFWFMQNINKIINRIDLPQLMDIKSYLPDAMFFKVDRSSMASSLEVRVPYTDNAIIDYALSSKIDEKSNNQHLLKVQLKNLLKSIAPHYSKSNIKKGFNFPLYDWLSNDWKNIVNDFITTQNLSSFDVDIKDILKKKDRFFKGDKRVTSDIWMVLNLVLWHNKYKGIKNYVNY